MSPLAFHLKLDALLSVVAVLKILCTFMVATVQTLELTSAVVPGAYKTLGIAKNVITIRKHRLMFGSTEVNPLLTQI